MKNHKLWWQSSYDRGSNYLLEMWPKIKEKFPDATLDLAYGWQTFDKLAAGNPERLAWKKKIVELMKQPGITDHGRVGKEELSKLRKSCGIWAYPTEFTEIFCISAIEAQKDGLVPVVVDLAALPETVQSGKIVSGDIKDPKTQEAWLNALFEVMEDEQLWQRESEKAVRFANSISWESQAARWTNIFSTKPATPLVTIFTPTIREGFWNLMANNIAAQSYENIEWVIVDDHKQNRVKTAKKYADKYGLNIRYFHGISGKKRTYSLVKANNKALEEAKGEIIVFLQDFVLMTPDGISKIVNVYNHHPNDLIALPDVYYSPKVTPNLENKEDWFDGEIDVAGKFLRKNQRIQNRGFRETSSFYDWEANYGAIPTKVARDLGGWWEFFDEALGFDNTEMAYRALATGHKIYIDESNIGLCIDHWGALGKDEGGKSVNRTRRLNDPRFEFLILSLKNGKLPIKRDKNTDDKIDLQYEIPSEVPDEKCAIWARSHQLRLAKQWYEQLWK